MTAPVRDGTGGGRHPPPRRGNSLPLEGGRDLIGLVDPAGDRSPSYEEWDENHAVGRNADHRIRVVVMNRRGSDKLNPFIHWAIVDAFVDQVAAIAPGQRRRWSTPEGPEGLPARRLAHWLTSLRLVGATS